MFGFVVVPAEILNISETETHQLRTNVNLMCNVEGDPRPIISWTKENHSSTLSPPKFQLSNYDQTLTIMNVSLNEQGTYICEAENRYAVVERNVTVNVEGMIWLGSDSFRAHQSRHHHHHHE